MSEKEGKIDVRSLSGDLQRLTQSDELDQLLVVVNPRVWIAQTGLILFLVVLFLWGFFGSLPITVQGRGIVIHESGFFSVQAKAQGMVHKVYVEPGQQVAKGELVAEVFDPQDQLRLEVATARMELLEKDLERLSRDINVEWAAERASLERQIEAQQFVITQKEAEIPRLAEDLETKKKLYEEGLLSWPALRDAESYLSEQRINIERTRAEVVRLQSALAKSYRTDEYKQKEQQALAAKEERDLLQMSLEFGKLYAAADGTVLEVLVIEGDRLAPGDPVLWMEHQRVGDGGDLVYAFIPVEQGKRVDVGTQVQMEMSTVVQQEHGKMLGIVKEISNFAVSREQVYKKIPNLALVDYLLGQGKVAVHVVIEPIRDPSTVSGYRWTSDDGPPMEISTGTVCTVTALIERIRPFYFILPSYNFREVANVDAEASDTSG